MDYQNPTDNDDTPFQIAHHTDKNVFDWLSGHPENFEAAMRHMSSARTGQKSWIADPELFLAEEFADDHDVLMVDVGGGIGHQCEALRELHAELEGRVVLQDLPGTIAMADDDRLEQLRIERQEHDFTTEQPVKGGKVYYLRSIMHNWYEIDLRSALRTRYTC